MVAHELPVFCQTSDRKSYLKKRDLIIVLIQVFLSELPRGIIVPTLIPYIVSTGTLDPQFFSAMSISAFSFGRLISSYPLGLMADKTGSSRQALLLGTLMVVIFNSIFSIAGFLPSAMAAWIIVAARFMVGFGSGTLGVARAYMSRISTKKERLRYVMYNTLLQYCGFSISPIISELVSFMIPKGESSSVVVLGLIPGLTTTALSLTMLFLLMFMRGVDPEQEEEQISIHSEAKIEYAGLEKKKSAQISPSASVESLSVTINNSEDSSHEYSGQVSQNKTVISEYVSSGHKLNSYEDCTIDYENDQKNYERKLLACFMLYLFLNFTLRGILSILETFGAEMFQEIESPYSKPSFEVITNSGRFFVGMGCVGVVMLLALPRLAKKFTPFNCLLFGILCMSIGTLMFTDLIYQPNLTFFSVAVLLIWSLGSPITQTLTISTYSQMMGNKPQGAAMGWLTTAGSMGRILFPLIGGLGFKYIGYINFIAAILSGVAVVGFRIKYGLEN